MMHGGVGGHGLARRRPTGWVARLARLPVGLYRLHLGWLLGHRFAQITHRGRRSGRLYRSVVEVVRFDHASREVVVLAGWRGQTDWYRNLQAAPAVEIRTGRLRFVPQQRLLGPEETVRELDGYVHRHPVVARWLARLFGIDWRSAADVADFFKAVSFRPLEARPVGGVGLTHAASSSLSEVR
jgi:deazaflavin-dependent oxidoreductase (nitroreductase family)